MKKLLLILLVLVLFISACGSGSENKTMEETSVGGISGNEETEDPKALPKPNLKDYNLNGRSYNILVQESHGWVNSRDFEAFPEMSGEPVNDAIRERVIAVEELYNCVITPIYSKAVVTDARKDVMAEGNSYDLIMPQMTDVSQIAGEGLLLDLNVIDTLHFEMPWWSRNACENLSVMHKLFYTLGDVSLIDNDGIAGMIFNKAMIVNEGLEMPYKYVYENKWTLDTLHDICKGLNRDLNGDGKMDMDDQYGFITDKQNIIYMIYAGGEQLVRKDRDDIPYPSVDNERVMGIIDKTIAMFNDDTAFAETTVFGGNYAITANNAFMNNQFLFRLSAMMNFTIIREMESDFGFIPLPKYEESQEGYHHAYSYASPGVAIPITVPDAEETGAVLEALAYYGRLLVLPAYYEINLQTKITRDEDSPIMLDIIFDSGTFDLGLIYNFGGIREMFAPFVLKNANTFPSAYESIVNKINADMDKIIDTFRSLG
ncbi:MAG: hypothetical protein FWF15_07125 [Oscillospiraceae bacterium]|nr:hypothetical protein [Oscillospiraceae bacterium]